MNKLPTASNTINDLPALKISKTPNSYTTISIDKWVDTVKNAVIGSNAPKLALHYKPQINEYQILDKPIAYFHNLTQKAQEVIAEDLFIEKINSGKLPIVGDEIEVVSKTDEDELQLISKFVMKNWSNVLNSSNWYIIMNGVKNFKDLEQNLLYYYKVLYTNKHLLPHVLKRVAYNFRVAPNSFAELFQILATLKESYEHELVATAINELSLMSRSNGQVLIEQNENYDKRAVNNAKLVAQYIDSDPEFVKQVFYNDAVKVIKTMAPDSPSGKFVCQLANENGNVTNEAFERLVEFVGPYKKAFKTKYTKKPVYKNKFVKKFNNYNKKRNYTDNSGSNANSASSYSNNASASLTGSGNSGDSGNSANSANSSTQTTELNSADPLRLGDSLISTAASKASMTAPLQ